MSAPPLSSKLPPAPNRSLALVHRGGLGEIDRVAPSGRLDSEDPARNVGMLVVSARASRSASSVPGSAVYTVMRKSSTASMTVSQSRVMSPTAGWSMTLCRVLSRGGKPAASLYGHKNSSTQSDQLLVTYAPVTGMAPRPTTSARRRRNFSR